MTARAGPAAATRRQLPETPGPGLDGSASPGAWPPTPTEITGARHDLGRIQLSKPRWLGGRRLCTCFATDSAGHNLKPDSRDGWRWGPHRRPARSSGGPMVGRRHRGPAGVGVRPESDRDPRFAGGCGFSTAREFAPQPLGEESFPAVATHLGGRNGSSPSGFSRAVALRTRGSTDCNPQRLRPRSEVSTTA